MRAAIAFLACLLGLLIVPAGCNGGGPSGGVGGEGAGGGISAGHGTVVVGVVTDLRVGVDILQLHVVMRADHEVLKDEVLSASSSKPLAMPAEFAFENLPGGTPIDITLEAFGPGASTTPLITRLASTTILTGKKLLFRVVLDSRCVEAPGSSAPSCTAPETCVAGQCGASAVDSHQFAAYSPDWALETHDICKPAGGGAPIVVVGEGQADYLPLADGDVDQVEAGPQGGHHIWVAIRMKNLRKSGSITAITGYVKDLDAHIGPFNVIFDFDQDEGGYCKLYGLRFQLDVSLDIDTLLGKTIDVTVTVTDKDGDVGIGQRTVKLSDTFI